MRRVGTVTNIFTQKRLYFLPKLPRHQGECGGKNPCLVTLVQQAVYFIRFHLQIELQFQQMAKTFMANISPQNITSEVNSKNLIVGDKQQLLLL